MLPKLDIRKWTLSCQLLEKKPYESLWLQVANWWGKTLCSIMPLLPWRYFVLFQIFTFLICSKREMQANLSNKCMEHPSRKFNVFLSRHAPQPISKPWGNFTYLVMTHNRWKCAAYRSNHCHMTFYEFLLLWWQRITFQTLLFHLRSQQNQENCSTQKFLDI